MKTKNEEETKEEFCAPCMMAVPMLFGASASGAGVGINNKWSMTFIISGIVITILSIILFFYLRNKYKDCKDCNL